MTRRALGSVVGPFTQDGAMMHLQEFIVGDDQVCLYHH